MKKEPTPNYFIDRAAACLMGQGNGATDDRKRDVGRPTPVYTWT